MDTLQEVNHPTDTEQDKRGSLTVAGALRWLGTLVFAGGSVAFLLQGLDGTNEWLRNWSVLVLMIIAGMAGITVQRIFEDAKGARVLLSIGLTLIPVQFAQLAGLTHDFLHQVDAVTLFTLLVGGGLSLLIATPMAYAGFRVLARPHAGFMTAALLGAAAMLLLPWRSGELALGVVVVMLLGALWSDRQVRLAGVRRTLESHTARLVLALPFTVALVRYGFYLESTQGYALFSLMVAIGLGLVSQLYLRPGVVREGVLGLATTIGVLAWLAWSSVYVNETVVLSCAGFALLLISFLSRIDWAYRTLGLLVLVLTTQDLIFGSDVGANIVAVVLGAALATLGYLQRWRETLVIGVLISLCALLALTLHVIAAIEVSSWVGLTLAGVTLVIAGSVVERHGRGLITTCGSAWQAFKAW